MLYQSTVRKKVIGLVVQMLYHKIIGLAFGNVSLSPPILGHKMMLSLIVPLHEFRR